MERDERIEKRKNGIEHNEKAEGEEDDQFDSELKEKGMIILEIKFIIIILLNACLPTVFLMLNR